MFRTIVAKYAGSTCKRCHATIAIGEQIRYGGPGQIYHLASVCGNTADAPPAPDAYLQHAEPVETADGAPAGSYGRPAVQPRRNGKFVSRRRQTGSTYTRFSSGAEQYTNRNGRCEDAPCCGCCS